MQHVANNKVTKNNCLTIYLFMPGTTCSSTMYYIFYRTKTFGWTFSVYVHIINTKSTLYASLS